MNPIFCFLFLSLIPLSLANKTPQDDEYLYIEPDLPDLNLFKATGYWTVRATSLKDIEISKVNIMLDKDIVIAEGKKGFVWTHTWQLKHPKDSKRIDAIEKGKTTPAYFLYQDHDLLIAFYIRTDNKKNLIAGTRIGSNVTDEQIREVINKILTKAGVQQMIAELVPNLTFLPQLPATVPEREDFPISDEELVDVDLTQRIGNVTIRAMSEKFLTIDGFRLALEANEVIAHLFYNGKASGMAVTHYIEDSRVLKAMVFTDQFLSLKWGYTYADENMAIVIVFLHERPKQAILLVLSRSEAKFDADFAKKVIENQLLFSRDIRRKIGHLVPKLVFA